MSDSVIKPLLFLSLIVISSARLFSLSELDNNEIDHKSSSEEVLIKLDYSGNSENLWVVDLNENIDCLKLRRATKLEELDFDTYTGYLIDEYLARKQRMEIKSSAPKPATSAPVVNVTKEDIFKYLNKYSLFSKTEPDAYLTDSHEDDEPSIAIFFKGGFSSLIVSIGMRQWHYFLAPSSRVTFPSWFYLDHHGETPDSARDVPKEVRDELYPVLYRVLQLVLTHPL